MGRAGARGRVLGQVSIAAGQISPAADAATPFPSPDFGRGEGGRRDEVRADKRVRYRVVEATTEKGLGFDPAAGSRGGNVACPFCGTVAH